MDQALKGLGKKLDGMDRLSDQIGRYDHLSDVIWKNLFQ